MRWDHDRRNPPRATPRKGTGGKITIAILASAVPPIAVFGHRMTRKVAFPRAHDKDISIVGEPHRRFVLVSSLQTGGHGWAHRRCGRARVACRATRHMFTGEMKWESERRSDNVEDRRGISLRGGGAIGGGAVVVALIAALLGAPEGFIRQILGGGEDGVTEVQDQRPRSAGEEKQADFVKVVLGSTEDVWTTLLSKGSGHRYEPPKLVLFRDAVQSACGINGSAVGPFYCPSDRRVYLDLNFFAELDRRFGAPGDFAQAYVVAHEVGHHVQNLLGISERAQSERERSSEVAANRVSVATELQADCFAGVWAFHANRTRHLLEPGDVQEGLGAASAIGDDRLQREARGRVVPESFTHGSSAQRVHWFKQGMSEGRIGDCDTFATQGR
jgi:uncharacterized protein